MSAKNQIKPNYQKN